MHGIQPGVPVETTVIENGTLVVGDGSDPIADATLVMAGGRIAAVADEAPDRDVLPDATYIDAGGDLVIPGVINAHAHSLLDTPMSASGAPSPGRVGAKRHRDRHLLDGCTTVVNVDSFGLPAEHRAANEHHPLKVELAACPTPANREAAKLIDGQGLTAAHERASVPDVVEAGAVLLGEVGGPTLVGGVQRYQYIPDAVERETGHRVTPLEASRLIDAVIGKYADPAAFDEDKAADALAEAGLADDLAPTDVRDIVMETTWPSVDTALEGFDEVAAYATAYDIPMMIHASPTSKATALELAEGNVPLIAGHTNYPTFDHDEALQFASRLDDQGVTVEACSWDIFAETNGVGGDPEEMRAMLFEFVREGLVDYLSTDYGDATFDGTLVAVEKIVENDVAPLGEAVALVSGNVAAALPGLGSTRGRLARGKAADVVIADEASISDVKAVYVNGRRVVDEGELAY